MRCCKGPGKAIALEHVLFFGEALYFLAFGRLGWSHVPPFQQTPPPPLAAALRESLNAAGRRADAEARLAFEHVIHVATEYRWL